MKKWTARRHGFVLPLALIVMVLGIVLVSVALDIAHNQYSSTANVVDEVDLYQAALEGIEQGKIWLRDAVESQGALPEMQGTWTPTENGDSDDYFNSLLITVSGDTSRTASVFQDLRYGGASLKVYVYDLSFSGVAVGDFADGFPPRMAAVSEQAHGFSARMTSTYVTSNRGEGSTGTVPESVPVAFYMIRSIARQDQRMKIIEQVVSVSE